MKCRHRGTQTYQSASVYVEVNPREVVAFGPGWATAPGQLRCDRCGATLPLGPSNDSDPRVQLEMRAAELAARRGFGSFSNCGAGCERCGFVTHKHGTSGDAPHQRCNAQQFHAGYLAGVIVNHDDHDTRCSTEGEG